MLCEREPRSVTAGADWEGEHVQEPVRRDGLPKMQEFFA